MSIFQLLALFFGLFMIYLAILHQKKRILTSAEAFLWFALWIGFLILTIFPDILDGVVDLLHFSRVFDLLLVMSLMVLTVVVYLSYIKQRKSESILEELTRKYAIENVKNSKGKM